MDQASSFLTVSISSSSIAMEDGRISTVITIMIRGCLMTHLKRRMSHNRTLSRKKISHSLMMRMRVAVMTPLRRSLEDQGSIPMNPRKRSEG